MRAHNILGAVFVGVAATISTAGIALAGVDVAEDHPDFNCTTMGDHVCGLTADPEVVRPPAHCWSIVVPATSYRPTEAIAWYMSNGGPHDKTNQNATLCEEEFHVLTDEERENS